MECSNTPNKKTGAIVVLYNPDIPTVRNAPYSYNFLP